MANFLPPVVLEIVGKADQAIATMEATSASAKKMAEKVIAEAQKQAAAQKAAADEAAQAAEKSATAAEAAAEKHKVAVQKRIDAEAKLAEVTKAAEGENTAAVEKAAAAVEAAKAREAKALEKSEAAAKASADAQVAAAEKAKAAEEASVGVAEASAAKRQAALKSAANAAGKIGVIGAGAAALVAGASVDMAVKFQTSTTKLVTSAGETDQGLAQVRDGILAMSSQVGVTANDLSDAMYKVESAGYHGAAGLGLLKAAEEGAKAEGADGAKVTDALSSAMRDYYPHAQSAADVTKASTDVMSKLIGATSAGKMTFDELAGSLNSILPVASAAKISLSDTLGVLASMTVHGISAEQATQNMADAIRHLQAPTQTMAKAMASLGIDSTEVAQKLGERGLSGTMQFLSEKVKAAMPPGTEKVIVDLGNALSKSSPQVQELGQKLMDGTITMKEFTQAAKELDPISYGQATQFATLAKSTHQIGNQMISGGQVLATYGGMMQKVMGDATGLKVALMTTGENADYTKNAIKTVSGATADSAGNVKGWSEVQKNAGQSLADLKASVEALAIKMGDILLPAVKVVTQAVQGFTDWAGKNPQLILMIVGAVAALSAVLLVFAGTMAIVNLVMAPEGLIVLAIVAALAALVAIIVVVWMNWDNIVKFMKTVWGGFVNWFTGVMAGFGAWWKSWWDPFAKVVSDVWNVIVTAAKFAFTLLATLVFAPLRIELNLLGAAFDWLYKNAIKPAWDWITKTSGDAHKWLDDNVFKPMGDGLKALGILWDSFYKNTIKPAWDGIQKAIGDAWNWIQSNVVKPINDWLDLQDKAWNNFSKTVIKPVWDYIQKSIGDSWNWIVTNVFNPIHDALDGLGKSFDSTATWIGKAWDKIKGAASGPVHFIVDNVYTNGIEKTWNDIASSVGLDLKLPDVKLGFASGGVMPGYSPGVDNQIIAVGGGESIMRPEWTRAVGADRVHAMNAMARNGDTAGIQSLLGLSGFADGGVVGAVGNFIGNIAGHIGDFLSNPAKSIGDMIKAPVDAMKGAIGGGNWGEMLWQLPQKVIGSLIDKAKGLVGKLLAPSGGAGGGSGAVGSPGAVTGDLAGWVQAAMGAAGVSGGNWLNGLETIAMHESGGNPNATNNWDSNAAMGDPSRGLMQTIGSTFEAYRSQSLPDDIFNPVANIVAAIGYIKSRYGDIGNVPGLVSMANGGGYQGYATGGIVPTLYDSGGWLPQGLSVVENKSGRPEPVFTGAQFDAMKSGGTGARVQNVNVYAQTNATPAMIASEVGWALTKMA